MTTPDGQEVGFHGTYQEVAPPERLVYTEIYEVPGASDSDAVVNTVTLTEQDGRTFMVAVTECGTAEVRDIILQSGMEAGMQDAYDLMEELAISLE